MVPDRDWSTFESMPESEEGDLEKILGVYIDRLNAGEILDRRAILREHPELAEEILERLQVFQTVGASGVEEQPLGTLGDYTLRRPIGRGGMGVVYEAWENSMDRRVALKVLPPGVGADERALQRFVREAKTAGQLSHPNVVSVYGMGLKEQTPYYAMEFVEGETLAQILGKLKDADENTITPFGKRGELAFYSNLATAFAGVAEGIQHAHSKGIIHRDLKPSNLILDREGRLRILDFGLARLEGQESLTVSGDLVGTVQYMSPEQARVRKIPIDHRTDVYSLGATLYEVLTWRPPFKGKNYQDTLSQIIDRDPVEPRKLNARVPRELETIVLKCLRKETADRYGTAEALGQDLKRFVRGDPVEARPQSRWEKSARRLRRHWLGIASAMVLIALLAWVGGLLLKARRDDERMRLDGERIRLARYVPDVSRAVQLMHFGQLTTMVGLERARRFDPGGLFVGEEAPAGAASPLLEAVEALDRLAREIPSMPDAYYHRARAFLLLEKDGEALADLDRALAVDGEFVPAFVLKAAIFERRGEAERARQEIEKAERSAGSAWARELTAAYRAVEALDWDAASRSFDGVLAQEAAEIAKGGRERYVGSVAEMYIGRGMAHLKRGAFTEAILDFGAARAFWREALDPVLLLGEALILKGERETAEESFQAFHRDTLHKDEAALAISARLWHLTECDRGLRWADRIGDKVIRTRARMAHLLLMGRTAEAVLEGESVPEGMDDARFCGNLALASVVQGEWETFEALAARATRLEKRYALMWRALGAISAGRGDLDASVEQLRRSLQCSEHPATFCCLGETFFLKGDPRSAELEFRKAVALFAKWTLPSPGAAARMGDYSYQRNFGALLEHLGRPREALEEYLKVLEVVPDEAWTHDRLASLFRRERSPEFWDAVDASIGAPGASSGEKDARPRALMAAALSLVHRTTKRDAGQALERARLAVEKSRGEDSALLAALAEVQEASGDLSGAAVTLERAIGLPEADAALEPVLGAYRRRLPPHRATYETLDALLGDGGAEVLVPEDAEWAFLRGRGKPSEGLEWTRAEFDDRGWERGESPLGYGFAYFPAARLDDMPGAYSSVHARKFFEVPDPGAFRSLRLQVWADDGFVAYLNGAEAGRARVEPQGQPPSYGFGLSTPIPYVVKIDGKSLSAGTNCLALHGVNHPASQHGFFLQALLIGDLRPDPRRALELLGELRREVPGPEGRARILYVEGRSSQIEGKASEAAEKFRELAELDPDQPLPHLRLAQALRSSGRAAEAEEALRSALPRFSGRRALWDLWFEIAALDLKLGSAEMLAGLDAAGPKSLDGHGADVRWLLGQLRAGGAVRIDCGGGDSSDSAGSIWGRDRFFLGGREITDGVELGSRKDLPLHRSRRAFIDRGDVPCGYRIPLPPGEYRVGLHFSERTFVRPGHRVFAVRLEGDEVLEEYDPSGAGFATPDVKTWNVVVEDGFLDLALVPRVGDPEISAIEIERVR